uniref:p53 and DNA damage-regulated protein 1 n=1 Tax=Mesocestoides corti TaxID=53468 RepID=A0A5K3FC99_MESCO
MEASLREKMFRDLEAVEAAAEKIISSQERCKLYEINRRKSQEALNRLNDAFSPKNVWACLSHQFFEVPKSSLKTALKSDMDTLSSEISSLRDEIKRDLDNLRELEGKNPLKGFNLRPLAKDELSAITGLY